MIPSHARKGGRRYRYYVSKPLIVEGKNKDSGGRRIPAADIERIVVNWLRLFLSDGGQVFDSIQTHVRDQGDRKRLIDRATEVSSAWPELPHAQTRSILIALVARVDVHADRVDVRVVPNRLDDTLRGDHSRLPPASDISDRSEWLSLSVPARIRRTGMEVRLIVEGHDPYNSKTRPDPSLIKLIVKAHQLHDKLVHGGGQSLESIAAREWTTGSYFTRVVRLAWLAPDITNAILDARQPLGLTAAKLLRESRHLPLEWAEHWSLLGVK
jgi:hypothetical protein